MEVPSEILLTDNTQGIYKAGEEVHGIVKYTIDEPTEFTRATVALRGKGTCQWRRSLIHTCVGTETFVDQYIDLFETKKAKIAAGSYEKEFRFILPQEIPSSYNDVRCSIEYCVELEFLKETAVKISKRCIVIKVLGGIKPTLEQPSTTYEVTTENPTSRELVTFNVEIDKTIWIPGEKIMVQENIENLSDHIIAVKTELIEDVTYKSNCNHEKQVSETVNGTEIKSFFAEIKAQLMDVQSIATTPDMFTVHSKILTREYKVRVGFKLLSPAKEVHVEIPIVIGDKIVEFEEAKALDLPPSYSEVMNEE